MQYPQYRPDYPYRAKSCFECGGKLQAHLEAAHAPAVFANPPHQSSGNGAYDEFIEAWAGDAMMAIFGVTSHKIESIKWNRCQWEKTK